MTLEKIESDFNLIKRKSVVEAEEFIKARIKEDYYNKALRFMYSEFLIENNRQVESSRILDVPYKAEKPIRLIVKSLDKIAEGSPSSLKGVYKVTEQDSFVISPIKYKSILPDEILMNEVFADEGKTIQLEPSRVYAFSDSSISCNGAFFTKENEYPSDNRVGHGAFLKGVYFDTKYSWHRDESEGYEYIDDNVFVFQKHPMVNYYHFLIEQAPNLYAFKKLVDDGVDLKPFLHANKFQPMFKQLNTLLDIYDENDMISSQSALMKFKTAYRPSYSDLSKENTFITPKLRQFSKVMLSSAEQKCSLQIGKRIFISRGDAGGKRDIVNESEVKALLTKNGFDVVTLTGLSLQQQVNIFRNAEIVIAGHGAGLSNIIFCPPGCKVVELTHWHTLQRLRIFWDLASYFGLEFSVICSEVQIKDHSAGFTVPMEQLKALLTCI